MKLSRESIDQKLTLLRGEAEERDARRRAEKEDLSYLDLGGKPIDSSALELMPRALAEEARAAGFSLKGKRLALALYSKEFPKSRELIKSLEGRGFKLDIFIVSLSGLS